MLLVNYKSPILNIGIIIISRHSEIEDGETPVKVKKENEKEFLTKVKVEKDEVFRCETQMIETYSEYKSFIKIFIFFMPIHIQTEV